jgi:hypothetical protein
VGFTQQGKVTALDVELYNNAGKSVIGCYIGCYIEHRQFEEPTQGSLATLRTTAISQLSNHNW